MVPSTYEAGKLYNVLPSGNRAPDQTGENSGYDQTRADFDFDRGSNAAATRVNADGLIEKYRENIFTYSQDFRDASGWLVSNATKVSINETDPNGGLTAANITWTAGSGRYFYKNIQQGKLLTASFYIKSNGGGNKFRLFGDGANDLSQDFTATNEWQRFEFFFERGSGQGTGITNASDNSEADLLVAFAQLESGLVSTDYLESTSVTGKAGVLIDLPRIDYSSGAGALLLEPQRSNLIQYSEYFGGTGWSLDGGVQSITSNYSISPEGVKNAARLQLDKTGTTYSRLYVDAGSLGEATISVYMKSNTSQTQNVGLRYDGTGVNCEVTTEWQRFDLTATSTAVSRFQILLFDSIGENDETADISIYGAMLEQNASYPTSYIPNHGTSGGVTRAADSCSVTGASDVIGQTEGTLFVDFTFDGITSENRQIFQLSDGSANNLHFRIRNSNDLQAYGTGNFSPFDERLALTEDGRYKMALGYSNGDFAYYVNGVQIATDTQSTAASNLSEIYLGINNLSSTPLGGQVTEAVLFNERLTNEELATLTTL